MSRVAVHKQRSTLIGTETALKDNPSLTLRDWYGKQPCRIVLDLKKRLPGNLNVFDGQAETFVVTRGVYPRDKKAKVVDIEQRDVHQELLDFLYQNEIQSVIVEGAQKHCKGLLTKGYGMKHTCIPGIYVLERALKHLFLMGHLLHLKKLATVCWKSFGIMPVQFLITKRDRHKRPCGFFYNNKKLRGCFNNPGFFSTDRSKIKSI